MKNKILLFCFILLSSCAMITKGPVQKLEFTSNTDSVNVYVNGKDIGYTPTSKKLWKIKQNYATFYLTDGQEHDYQLKTHMNSAILNNGFLVLLHPLLGGLGFGVDYFMGSGRSFDERTLRFEDMNTGKEITVDITEKIFKPENYVMLCAGAGVFPHIISSEEKKETEFIFIPSFYLEKTRSYRERYHLGFGIGIDYLKRVKEYEDRISENVFHIPMYVIFKWMPFFTEEKIRFYFISHFGAGWAWGKVNGLQRIGPMAFYGAWGTGVDVNEKVYLELLSQGRIFDFIFGEGLFFGNASFLLRVGFRFDLKGE